MNVVGAFGLPFLEESGSSRCKYEERHERKNKYLHSLDHSSLIVQITFVSRIRTKLRHNHPLAHLTIDLLINTKIRKRRMLNYFEIRNERVLKHFNAEIMQKSFCAGPKTRSIFSGYSGNLFYVQKAKFYVFTYKKST